MQNKSWGIRNIEEVNDEAKKIFFFQEDINRIPPNNFSIIYGKVIVK